MDQGKFEIFVRDFEEKLNKIGWSIRTNEYSIRTEAEQRAEEERIKKEKMQNPAEPSAVTN